MKYIALLLIATNIIGCSGRPALITGKENTSIPSFNLLLMDSTTQLNTNNIPKGKPIVMFIFSPFCPYCKAQTQDIITDINLLKDTRLIMLSPFSFKTIKEYSNTYQLQKYSNITVAQDKDSYLGNYFNAKGVPYIAIYNSDKRLVQVLQGKSSIKQIKEIAFN